MDLDDHTIRDGAVQFTTSFDAVLAGAGIDTLAGRRGAPVELRDEVVTERRDSSW
jgi:hypothetical protein